MCSAQRKEPGCVVGEHMHVRRREAAGGAPRGRFTIWQLGDATESDRPGDVGRSATETRTDADEAPARWTRVGDAGSWWPWKPYAETDRQPRAAENGEEEGAKPDAEENDERE